MKHVRNWKNANEYGALTISKNSSIMMQWSAKNMAQMATMISADWALKELPVDK